jgi:hypothetical protein
MSSSGVEEPEDDVAEQRRSVLADPDQEADVVRERPFDVDEADAAEQERTIDLDDDEYR